DGVLHKSLFVKPDDLLYPCDVVRADQKSQCYGIQTSYVLGQVKWDHAKAFVVCDGAEADHVADCYNSMGRDISGADLTDAQQSFQHCSLGNPQFQVYCFIG